MHEKYRMLMSMVEKVLVLLLDGTWHDLAEVASSLQIDHHKLDKIVKLLIEFDFIETKATQVRIESDTKAFLESIINDTETRD